MLIYSPAYYARLHYVILLHFRSVKRSGLHILISPFANSIIGSMETATFLLHFDMSKVAKCRALYTHSIPF